MTQTIQPPQLEVGDLVQIRSSDSFNGMRGTIAKMRWGSIYVDLGVRNGIHFVVPFGRAEVKKVSEQ